MKKRSGIITLATLLAALLVAGCAAPQKREPPDGPRTVCVRHLDTNRDGKITTEEFMARTSDKNKGVGSFPEVRHG